MSSTEPSTHLAIQCNCDEGFAEWIYNSGDSLAITTYQGGKLLLIGWNGRQPSLHSRSFEKAMGLDVAGNGLLLATRNHLHFFTNVPELAADYPPNKSSQYDALYLPRVSYHTGELFAHDVAIAQDGLWFVNTLFSCLAISSAEWGFIPRWVPKFITDLVPEDRCHLNGLAMLNGVPNAVTALAASNSEDGWRSIKACGGIVIDVDTREIIKAELSMPHSPRWHDHQLWVLNSGRGELLRLDAARAETEIVCTLPGYLRGLAFIDNVALVGLCRIREKRVFGDLPIERSYSNLQCGIALVDIFKGKQLGFFEFTMGVEEIYDIRILSGIRQPNLLTVEDEWSKRALTSPDSIYTVVETTSVK